MSSSPSFPRQGQADIIVTAAATQFTLGSATDHEQVFEGALRVMRQSCELVSRRSGPFAAEMTPEQVREWEALHGLIVDIERGFVSPTVGNVRDYVFAQYVARTQQGIAQ